MRRADVQAGEVLQHRYRVDGLVGRGAQSAVYAATDRVLGLRRAIKRAATEDEQHLLREHVLLADVQHPNLVTAHELIHDARYGLLLVQDLAEGPDLLGWCGGDWRAACRAVAATARGLAHLHELGITHADVKPSNLRVGPRPIGRLPGVRLIDFGLARSARPWSAAWSAPQLDGMSGTPGYAAPEVLAGQPATPPADVHALGATLYEVLTGELVGLGFDPDALDRALDAATGAQLIAPAPRATLRELLADLLDPAPAQRPPASAVITALETVLDEPLQVDDDELRGDYFPVAPLVGRDEALQQIDDLLRRSRAPHADAPAILTLLGSDADRVAVVARALARGHGFEIVDALAAARASLVATAQPPGDADAPETAEQTRCTAGRLLDEWSARATSRPLLLDLGAADAVTGREALLVQEIRRQVVGARLAAPCDASCDLIALRSAAAAVDDPGAAPAHRVVRLAPLNHNGIAALVRSMRHGRDDPPWLAELWRRSTGDPRIVIEQTRAQIEAGDPTGLVATTEADTGRTALIQSRLSALMPELRELLEVIALGREPLSPELLVPLGLDRPTDLQRLVARGWIRIDGSGLRLADATLARAVAHAISEESAVAIHRRLARAWQQLRPPRDDLADHHRVLSGEFAPELLARAPLDEDQLRRAAAILEVGGEPWQVVIQRLAHRTRLAGQLERALGFAARLEAVDTDRGRLLRAELLLEAGESAQARELLESGPPELVLTSPRLRLLAARAAFLLGDYAAAERHAASAVLDRPAEPAIDLALQHLAGLSAVYRGDHERGLQTLTACEQRARQRDQRELLPRLLNSRGIALQRLGRPADATTALHEALAAARAVGDVRLSATIALNLGTLQQRALALAEALDLYREAQHFAARAGVGTTRGWAVANEANLLLGCGALRTAAARLNDAERLAHDLGAAALQGHVALYRAELLLREDRADDAERALERARELFGDADRAGHHAAELVECELWLCRRAGARAQAVCQRLAGQLEADDPERWRLHLLAGRTLLLLADHSPSDHGTPGDGIERAATEFDLALALARRSGSPELLFHGHALAAGCASRLERVEEAGWHALRCSTELAALRQRVPPAHRAAFDQRPDVQQARRTVDELRAAGALAVCAQDDSPRATELQRLLELNTELGRGLPVRALLHRILDRALELTGAERGFVLLRRDAELRVAASRNVDGDSLRRGMQRLSQSIAQTAISERRPVVAADAMSDDRFAQRLSVAGLRLRAVLCVPLLAGDQARGALYIDNRFRPDAFGARAVALLQAFAGQASVALHNAELIEDLARHRDALADAKQEVERLNQGLQLQLVQQSSELSEVSELLRRNEQELVRRYNAASIIGRSKPMRELFVQIDRLTDADVSVYIRGESGTGKELVARAIHFKSDRAQQPFVSLNCAAVPASLLESELFGHARGAFTGALRDRAGLFEAAGEGTLLLDEIGDMPPEMQVRLLRVLQERSFRRLGDNELRTSRCRVLAAGQQRLEQLVEQERFRMDLFYRLCVVQIAVPPLRERREDIPLLVEHILGRLGRPRPVSPPAMAALIDHDWPGNVRQLDNEVHRAVLLSEGPIGIDALSPEIARAAASRRRRALAGPARGQSPGQPLTEALQQQERQLIEDALQRTGGNVTDAARQLGISRVVLHRKIRKLGVQRVSEM